MNCEGYNGNPLGHSAVVTGALWGTSLIVASGLLLQIGFFRSYAHAPSPQVIVNPGDNIKDIVDRNPPGTTFLIKAGVHRLQSIVPKDRDSFIGEPGAILNGAKLLTSFQREGQYWMAAAQTERGQGAGRGRFMEMGFRGRCMPGHPACTLPEDMFIGDAPLLRVANKDDLGPGRWYADSGAGQVYLADDPTGHKVEISITPHAFSGSASNVTIRGLIVEKYGQPAGQAAIEGRGSHDWLVEKNEVRLNHATGIGATDGWRLLNNEVHHNGQAGVGGGKGRNILVEGNELAYNNFAGYHPGWEAGGAKFTFTDSLVFRGNYAHDNAGPGLWTDIENKNTLYERNRVVGNKGSGGIMHEISYDAVIRDNTIENDGMNPFGPGAGILVAESLNVEVYGNTVTNCKNGILGRQLMRRDAQQLYGQTFYLRNLYVHDNVITQNQGIAAGIFRQGPFGDEIFTRWHNRFVNNTFKLADRDGKYFLWSGGRLTLQEWIQAQRGE